MEEPDAELNLNTLNKMSSHIFTEEEEALADNFVDPEGTSFPKVKATDLQASITAVIAPNLSKKKSVNPFT